MCSEARRRLMDFAVVAERWGARARSWCRVRGTTLIPTSSADGPRREVCRLTQAARARRTRRGGTPRHVHHNEDETFYVLEGEVTFLVGDERIDVAAGDFLFAPREIPHAYVVRSERARILSTISPAGIEQLFVSLGTPVAGAEPPTDVAMPPMPEMARLFAAHGAEILGPPPSLGDLS